MTHYRQGFSLTEVSIILMVVGLLIGAIVAGRTLIRSAALQSVPQELIDIQRALREFKKKQGFLPGDVPAAQITMQWADFCTNNAVCTGDANGQVSSTEGNATWLLLRQAGYLENYKINLGEPYGGAPSSGLAGTGELLKSKHLDVAKYQVLYSSVFGVVKNFITIPAITPELANALDTKIDNGDPITGKVRASGGGATDKCLTAANDLASQLAASMGGAIYDLSISSPNCTVYVDIGF